MIPSERTSEADVAAQGDRMGCWVVEDVLEEASISWHKNMKKRMDLIAE